MQFMEEDLLQPHSAENLAGEELEESLLSHEEEVDTQNSTVVDASQKLNQVNTKSYYFKMA